MSPTLRTLALLATVAALAGCVGMSAARMPSADDVPPRGPDLVAGDTAALFAPGVVSTDDAFASSFAPDGRTVYFTKADRDRTRLRVMRSRWVDGAWTTPEALPFSDVAPRAMDPFVSPDGRRLYFTAARRLSAARGEPQDDWDTWVADLAPDGTVGAPRNLGPEVNGPEVEFCPSMSPDGRFLLFSRIGYRGEERVRDNVYAIRADAVPALRALRAQLARR